MNVYIHNDVGFAPGIVFRALHIELSRDSCLMASIGRKHCEGPGPTFHPSIRAFQFAIRIDSIRYANRFESIRFVKIDLSIH